MADPLRVLHVIASLHPSTGGTARVLVEAADVLAERGDVVPTLLFQQRDGEPCLSSRSAHVRRVVAHSRSRVSLLLGLPLRTALDALLDEAAHDVLHMHGLWLPVNYWTVRLARARRMRVVIQPHGTLQPWALRHRAWKKYLATWAFQQRDLRYASLLIANSEEEAEQFRKLGYQQPVVVIPNGLYVPEAASKVAARDAARIRTLLFVGRIHPLKGLLMLLEAWSEVPHDHWRVVIAGPDEGGHLFDVLACIRRLGLKDSVQYVGEVGGIEKQRLYEQADLFVLPSFTENFGLVVAEALAHGLPVIATQRTPWRSLVEAGCGWWVDASVGALQEVLRAAMSLDDMQRLEIGGRARQLARQFDWKTVGGLLADTYRLAMSRPVSR